MNIDKKHIRSLSRYLPGLTDGQKFRIARRVSDITDDVLQRIGFPEKTAVGDSLIPKAIGEISGFNAHGREVKRKDLPKEVRYFSVYTTWNDWHGNPHSGIQYRSVEAFPIEHAPGPAEALTLVQSNGVFYVASRVLENKVSDTVGNLHVVNLFLEIFRQCDVLDENISAIALPQVRRLNWRILPAGRYPWEKAREHFTTITKSLPEGQRQLIDERLKYISAFNPDFVAIGEGGFHGYFILGFSKKPVFIFESIHLGNATYVFDKNWEQVSKLTKGEILRSSLHVARVVHRYAWRREIGQLIQPS